MRILSKSFKLRNRLFDIYFTIFPEIIMNNHTYMIKQFIREISGKYDLKGKKLIDIGAEDCQYKKYFKNIEYFSQDIKNNENKNINYIGEIDTLPSGKFDYILCTQVLEHLKNPDKAFKNFFRILKKGGKVFLTTHMAFEEHFVPYDYYRFTRYGLKYLAEKNGFKVQKIKPQGGRFIVLAKELQTLIPKIIRNKTLGNIFYLVFSVPLFLLCLILFCLDFLDKDKTLTLNYECVFSKVN